MLETVAECPICGSNTFLPFLTTQDYAISLEEFQLQICQKCNFVITSPRPAETFLARYYESENYISHSQKAKKLIDKLYYQVRKITLKQKLRLINRCNRFQKGTLLDVGCGTGHFLKTCLQAGWQVAGIEPNEKARNIASQYIQKDLYSSLHELPSNKNFDVITLWHVLEHIGQLNEALAKLNALLTPVGTLVIAVPNRESYSAQYFKKFWAAYDVPRHLWHFTKKNLEELLQKHKLYIEKILPMLFDAYYISLLSTKYQSGKIQYLRALWQAWKANLKDGKNNTTSLIYLVKKSTSMKENN